MPDVLDLAAAGPARARKLQRAQALQRLDAGLLVDAENGRARRRIAIDAADYFGLGAEGWVGAVEPKANLVRPQLGLVENAADLTPAQPPSRFVPERIYQRPTGPDVAKGDVFLWPITGELDRLTAHVERDARRTATALGVVEGREPRTQSEPSPPEPHRFYIEAERSRDLAALLSSRCAQDDARSLHQRVLLSAAPRKPVESLPHLRRQLDCRCPWSSHANRIRAGLGRSHGGRTSGADY